METPLAARPGRPRRGSPESEDLPRSQTPNPSRKEDSCFASSIALSVLLALVLTPAAPRGERQDPGRRQDDRRSSAPRQPTVTADNALQALDVASTAGEFYYGTTTSSFGDYVSQIGKYAAGQSTGWVFKVNGVSPPVGRRQGRAEGRRRRALVLRDVRPDRRAADARAEAAAGQLLRRRVGHRRRQAHAGRDGDAHRGRQALPDEAGRACIGKHVGLVRATAPGAVRSNAVQ